MICCIHKLSFVWNMIKSPTAPAATAVRYMKTTEPGDHSSGTMSPTATAATTAADGLACNEAIPALLRWPTTPEGQEAMTTIGANIITRFLQDATAVTTLTTAVSSLLQDDDNQKAVAFAGAHLLQYSPSSSTP